MATFAVRIWRALFPYRCEWCDFTSRTPQGMGKHRKRCEMRPRAEVAT